VFHGWSGSYTNVLRWIPALTPHFRVIVPDLPGCHGVAALDGRHTARRYARWALARLDAMGVGDVYVAGLCSGTAIALALAEETPGRVRGLLLHTPFLRPDLIRPAIRAQMRLLGSPLGALYAPLRTSTLLANLHRRLFANAGEVPPAQLALDQDDLVGADARANRDLAADLLASDRVATLARWTRPLGVVLAASDAFVDAPRVALVVREAAPHAAIETIPGGHGWTSAYVVAQHQALSRIAPRLLAAR
jgi:pimeloyl-ACP methyl ester carboxylesterase